MSQQTNNPYSQVSLQYSRLKTEMCENSLPTKKCNTEKEKKKKSAVLAFSINALRPLACFDSSFLLYQESKKQAFTEILLRCYHSSFFERECWRGDIFQSLQTCFRLYKSASFCYTDKARRITLNNRLQSSVGSAENLPLCLLKILS